VGYVLCVVALLTVWSVRGECVFFSFFLLSCIFLRCSCRIYTIVWSHEDFIHVCLYTNHFL